MNNEVPDNHFLLTQTKDPTPKPISTLERRRRRTNKAAKVAEHARYRGQRGGPVSDLARA